MRFIKLGILSFVLLFLIITGISLFIPSHVRISRAVNIKTQPDSIWNQLDDLRKWEQWNPFFNNLQGKKIEWLDTNNGKVNAMKVQATTIRWIDKKPGEHIAEMLSGNRKPMHSGWKCIMNDPADSLTLQWYMDFHLHWYPWEKFTSLLFEKSYGTRMEQGLSNLKTLLEK